MKSKSIYEQILDHIAEKPVAPLCEQKVHGNSSLSAIMHVLNGQDKAIAMLSDEASTLLDSEVMNATGFMNQAWDGATLKFNRRNGNMLIAQDPRVTVGLMVQPDVWDKYQAKASSIGNGSGFWARSLAARPMSNVGMRFLAHDFAPDWSGLEPFHARMKQLMAAPAQEDLA